jgi:hypothetical protein
MEFIADIGIELGWYNPVSNLSLRSETILPATAFAISSEGGNACKVFPPSRETCFYYKNQKLN